MTEPRKAWALRIEYDGTGFQGWQRQNNGSSVQEVLEDAAARLNGGEPVPSVAAGRTDAGVHAAAQVALLALPENLRADQVRDALNFHMRPHPVVILQAAPAPPNWSPRFSATSRASLPAPAAQPCAVALGPGINQTDNGTGNVGILLLASATLSATNCEVWSNVASPSNADYSIMALASGAVTAKQIGANGNFGPSGQTTITASSGGPGPNKGTVADPFAGWTKPTDPGTCVNPASSGQTSGAFNQLSASYTTSAASPTTFCGDATHTWAWRPSIGRTVTFGPGVYYFVNTNATFQNQGGTITFGSGGVSFVFLGRGASGTAMVGNLKWSAGNFTWTPNSDSAYGISYLGKAFAIVQLCDSPNVTTYQQMTMSQSSIVTMNDAVYLPCGEFQVTGTAQVKPPLGSNLSVVAASFGLSQTSAGAALTVSAAASAAGTLSLQPTQ